MTLSLYPSGRPLPSHYSAVKLRVQWYEHLFISSRAPEKKKRSQCKSFISVRSGEASTSGEGDKKSSPVKASPSAQSPEGARSIERSIEARPVDDSMASMVRYLYFADTFLINGQNHTPTLWAGTNGGTILICRVTVPANDKRDSDSVTCELGECLFHGKDSEFSAHSLLLNHYASGLTS